MKNQNTPTTLPVIAATFAAITGLSSAAAPATLSHRWSFNGNLNDAVATAPSPAVIIDPDNNAATGGAADLTTNAGQITLGGGGRDQSSYVKLGTSLLAGKTTPVTIEFWATQIGIQNWARIFDFGTDTNQYLMMSWTRQTNANQDTLTWKNGAESAVNDKNAPYELGREYHVVLVIEPGAGTAGQTLVTEYAAPSDATTMGAPKAVMSTSFTLANFADPNDFLGRSQWPDETAHASYNEFRIWTGAMVPEEIDDHQTGGPNLTGFVDTDTDGMPDWWETLHGLNIGDRTDANQDADHDGATNLQEYLAGSDPQDANSNALDLDGDKLTDSWEIAHFGGLGETGAGDPDNDGATNLQEQAAGSDPLNPNSFPDTDGDGINDVWEKKYFTGTGGIPAFNAAAANATNDYDGDGFTNLEEFRAGSNPVLATSSPAFPTLAHRWAFNGDLTDSVTGPDASDALIIDPDNDPVTGPADLTTKPGEVYLAGGAKGAAGYVSVGTNLLTGNLYPVTVELWATTYSLQSWSRIFDFGSGENEYVMASWNVNGNESLTRTSWKNGAELSKDATFSYTHGTKYHIVVSIEPPAGTRKLSRVTTYAAAADGTATTMGPPLGVFYTTSKLATVNDVND
ncbi:MAG: hypothetical protein JWO82_1318, partial [Akkermansiaceae bacterium]|nr:hypothetical protein [Akkermansiaceae bacterium]